VGQKTSLAEQGNPRGAQEEKETVWSLEARSGLCRKIAELWFTYAGRRYERPKLS